MEKPSYPSLKGAVAVEHCQKNNDDLPWRDLLSEPSHLELKTLIAAIAQIAVESNIPMKTQMQTMKGR